MIIADHPHTTSPTAPVLRAIGLKRSFGRMHAVEGVDLNVRAGEIYGFLGINGAGKTTTIRMLMGILKPDAGSIELLGHTTRRISARQKQSIGYVSQEQTFYPWMTARGLGRFVGGLYPTWDAAEYARLLEVLEVPAERKVSQLSGGMKVKLALALAIAPRPALLILDEPTAGLDPVARREFLDVIQRQARNHQRTTFFSSHLIDEVERVADRVGIIHRGRMKFEGDLASLRARVRQVRIESKPPAADAPFIQPPPLPPPLVESPGSEAPAGSVQVNPSPPLAPLILRTAAPEFVLPPNFEVLRDEISGSQRTLILSAPAEEWEAFRPECATVHPLSLEDIFIALVGSGTAAI